MAISFSLYFVATNHDSFLNWGYKYDYVERDQIRRVGWGFRIWRIGVVIGKEIIV